MVLKPINYFGFVSFDVRKLPPNYNEFSQTISIDFLQTAKG